MQRLLTVITLEGFKIMAINLINTLAQPLRFSAKFVNHNEQVSGLSTSRFVQDEATFECYNLNLTYDLNGNEWLKKNLGIENLTLKGDIADLFRISTIRQERGTSYPFSRQFSFSLTAMF